MGSDLFVDLKKRELVIANEEEFILEVDGGEAEGLLPDFLVG